MKIFARLFFVALLAAAPAQAQVPPINEFFDAFTDEWMRFNTDAAAGTRYFTGAEQERVERLLSPQTRENALQRIALDLLQVHLAGRQAICRLHWSKAGRRQPVKID